MKRTSALAILSTLIALAGCGGGSTGSTAAPKVSGKAMLNVIWPERTEGRLIPTAANSLKVILSQGGTPVSSQTIARPAAGQTTTSTTFVDLPIGGLDVAISAFPTTDATGVAQATGAGTMAVAEGTPGAVTVSLVSTVSTLAVSPAAPHIGRGGTGTLTVSAKDSANNIVLLAATGVEPITWTAGTAGIVSISGTGPTATLTGVAVGTTAITARLTTNDSGATVSGTANVSVVAGSGTVTIR